MMHILQVHNYYRTSAGECRAVDDTVDCLRQAGQRVTTYTRNSREIGGSTWSKLYHGLHSPYSLPERRRFTRQLLQDTPDIVHIHNLYPLITPSVLDSCRTLKIPVVMTCHNYRLSCPTSNFFRNNQHCKLCIGGREYHCFLKNCRNSRLESFVYALRHYLSSRGKLYQRSVTSFIAISDFVRDYLIEIGIEPERIERVNNCTSPLPVQPQPLKNSRENPFIGFAGRLVGEKGFEEFIKLAELLPQYKFKAAGDLSALLVLPNLPNLELVGQLSRQGIGEFFRDAQMVVLPTTGYEAAGLVALEAMGLGTPVIAYDSGGLPEMIGPTAGIVVPQGDLATLAAEVDRLAVAPEERAIRGEAGKRRIHDHFSPKLYSNNLLRVYRKVLEMRQP